MKIVPKLTLALVAGTCLILGANGYLRVRREVGYFEADRVRDHEMIGRSLAAAVSAVWKSEGEAPAVQSVAAVSAHFQRIQIRWVPAADIGQIKIDPAELTAAPTGQPVTRAVQDELGRAHWYTYVTLDAGGARRGAIELSEPATLEQRFVRGVVTDTIVAYVALALLSAVVAFVMGQWLVGTPVRLLSDKARRIGRGDFSSPIALRQADELGVLGREMNAMCDKLAETLDQLRHADRLATVGKLASGVAHELGTPLNVVSARASMIHSGETTAEETRDYARVIGEAAERMTKIIQQLLQFARRKGSEKSPRDLATLAKETLDLLRPLADKKAAHLSLTAPEEKSTVEVDPAQLQQVITNLVMNAVQAMPAGGDVELRVQDHVRAEPPPGVTPPADGSLVCLEVRDHGKGIPPEDLPHVFEPFFTTKDVGEGTGLGLAVAYGIVREHGGWIDVESKAGEGTRFNVYLPRPR